MDAPREKQIRTNEPVDVKWKLIYLFGFNLKSKLNHHWLKVLQVWQVILKRATVCFVCFLAFYFNCSPDLRALHSVSCGPKTRMTSIFQLIASFIKPHDKSFISRIYREIRRIIWHMLCFLSHLKAPPVKCLSPSDLYTEAVSCNPPRLHKAGCLWCLWRCVMKPACAAPLDIWSDEILNGSGVRPRCCVRHE